MKLINQNHRDSSGVATVLCISSIVFCLAAILPGCRQSSLITEEDRTDSIVAKAQATQAEEDAESEKDKPRMSRDAFWKAATDGRLEKVREGLDSGIDPNIASPEGRVALQLAAFDGHTDVVKLLLKAGAEVNHRDEFGRSAILYAASGDNRETVQVLIDAGAEVNVVDSGEGFSPLMHAAAEGHLDVVQVLLDASADTTLVDEDGDTAESFARKGGHVEVVKLLQSRQPEAQPEDSADKDSHKDSAEVSPAEDAPAPDASEPESPKETESGAPDETDLPAKGDN